MKPVQPPKALMLLLTLLAATVLLGVALAGIAPSQPDGEALIKYHSDVCVYKNGELIQCDHNLLYDSGKDMIKTHLGASSGAGLVTGLSLCNATAGCGSPVAAASETFTAYNSCGLSNVSTATYASTGTGNWSISNTFTSTCDNVLTNATRLTNTTYSPFAGNTFSLVTLQTNDQLTVTWNISVS